MEPLAPVLAILSAMITPVVLISACASLILSTSNRSNRVVDNLYEWSAEFRRVSDEASATEANAERRKVAFELLDLLTSRARLLQRCLSAFHIGLGLFVATSVTIGVAGISYILDHTYVVLAVLPVVLSLVGALYLLYASYLLVAESRLALRTTEREMDFVWWQGQRQASADLLEWQQQMRRSSSFRRFVPRRGSDEPER